MKVRSNDAPANNFRLEKSPRNPNLSIVSFFENIKPFTEQLEDGQIITGYEYDEYTIKIPKCSKNDVQINFNNLFNQAKLSEKSLEEKLEESNSIISILLQG